MLLLDSVTAGGPPAVRVRVAPGEWAVVAHPDADALIAAVAATGSGDGGVLLDGRELSGLPAHERARAGLATISGRIGDLAGVRVVEVLQLAAPGGGWRAALGVRRARERSADTESDVRSLAGRVGLGPWLDKDVVDLPSDVQALTDLTRGLVACPRAVVWRRPEWLDPSAAEEIATVLHREQQRRRIPVVELRTSRSGAWEEPWNASNG